MFPYPDYFVNVIYRYRLYPTARLRRWQIAPVEDHQPNDPTHQAGGHQNPGIPPGQVMVDQRVDGRGVVERADLEHPLELVGEATKGVDQIAQHNDAHRCSPGCPAGIDEGPAEHAQTRREEEEGPLNK